MATLTTKRRSKLKKNQFGLPGSRKYPMPDKAHAVNAKVRASQQYKRGKLSKSARDRIVAKANRKRGTSGKKSATRRKASSGRRAYARRRR